MVTVTEQQIREQLMLRYRKQKQLFSRLSWKTIRLMIAGRIPKPLVEDYYQNEWGLIFHNGEQHYPLSMLQFLSKNRKACYEQTDASSRLHMFLSHVEYLQVVFGHHNLKWRRAVANGSAKAHNQLSVQLLQEFEQCAAEASTVLYANWTPLTVREWQYYREVFAHQFLSEEEIKRAKETIRQRNKKKRKPKLKQKGDEEKKE